MDKIFLDTLMAKLKPIFETNPAVGLVYLFGSQAQGNAGATSDYDFAVFFGEKDSVRRADLLFRITSDISKALGTNRIDGKSLNDIDAPELKYHIITDGVLIFEREPFKVIIEPHILNEYSDFVYLLRRHQLTKAATV